MRINPLLICVLILTLISCNRFVPEFTPDVLPNDGVIINEGMYNALKAVGQYDGESRCTAVFVKLSDNLGAPAYVLTNGHCVQDWDASAVYQNVPTSQHTVTFNLFQNEPTAERVMVPVKQIAYSTMKGTDLAIVELNTTVGDLVSKGVNPLPIAKTMPGAGTPLRIVGVPVDGLPEAEWVLRQATGSQGRKTDLIEFVWTWWDMYANDAPGIVGGYSGSPVLTSYRDGVVGLINTTTNGGGSPCYLGFPCELTAQGAAPQEKTNYMLSVLEVPSCFTPGGVFDLNALACILDKGKNVVLSGYPAGALNPAIPLSNNQPQPATWNTTVTGYSHYRYKIGLVGATNPRDLAGYSEVIATVTRPVITDSLPKTHGRYVLSVIGGSSPAFGADWQQPRHATLARVEIDTQTPTEDPKISVQNFDDVYSIELRFNPPELSYYYYKIGKPEVINANDPKGYRPYRRVPIEVNKADLPLKLCVYGTDIAGNPTKIVEKILDR